MQRSFKSNAPELLESLAKVRAIGLETEPLLDIAGTYLVNATKQHFEDGRSPAGFPWPRSWRARVQGGKTMIDRGNLVNSIRHETTPDKVTIGVDGTSQSSKFSYVLHYGATILPKRGKYLVFRGPDGHMRMVKRVEIPARPFLGINADDIRGIKEQWRDYARRRLKG